MFYGRCICDVAEIFLLLSYHCYQQRHTGLAMNSMMTLHAVIRMDPRYWLPLLALVSLSSSQCDLTPSQGQMTGRVTGISCLEYSYAAMTFLQCALKCYRQAQCRVAYLKCENSSCICVLCPGVEEIDFSVGYETFFLKGRVLAKNATIPPDQRETIPGGLSVGQVIVAKLVLASEYTALRFDLPNGDIAFAMSIRVGYSPVIRNTFRNGQWGLQESSKPHFNFTSGQEVEIVCIITQVGYKVYIDKILFFTYQHRLQINLATIQYVVIDAGGTSGHCKSLLLVI